jgi:hypothetical protein
MASRALSLMMSTLAFALGSAVIAGCTDEDTGTCCYAFKQDAGVVVPVPDQGDGGPARNVFIENPGFNCDKAACLSYQGSSPFCTRICDDQHPCPQGFMCVPPIEAKSSADASIETYCVRANCDDSHPCPKGFDCTLVHQGHNSVEDPAVSLCQRSSDMCTAM